jgi:Fe2+ or Zn2+ uptake regulation protein
MTTLKYSRQREAIKKYLSQTKEHPTADMVYMYIRSIFPNVSLGTVYRNLNLLVDLGEALKLSHGLGADRFDGNVVPHCHFLCTECQKVLDLDIDLKELDRINEIARHGFDGEIRGYSAFFYGKCPECC